MKINSVLLLLLTIISTVFIAVVGIVFRTTVYSDYYTNPIKTTSIGAVFQGAASGIYPWVKPVATKDEQAASKTAKKKAK